MARADVYASFDGLRLREHAEAFSTRIEDRGRRILVMAIHGGAIEPGTSEIATATAGHDFDLYLFEGRKSSGNASLHLTSHRFDEPQALQLVARSEIIISVHGCRGSDEITYLGGGDAGLASRIACALRDAGFEAEPHQEPNLQGKSPFNVCNRGLRGAGVQLELSRKLRDVLVASEDRLARYASCVHAAALASS